eukprot:5072509-Ditylum_brightwellii.AAC.1
MNKNITIKKPIAEQIISNEGPNARDNKSEIGVDERNVMPVHQVGEHSEYVVALTAHRKSDTQHSLASIP